MSSPAAARVRVGLRFLVAVFAERQVWGPLMKVPTKTNLPSRPSRNKASSLRRDEAGSGAGTPRKETPSPVSDRDPSELPEKGRRLPEKEIWA